MNVVGNSIGRAKNPFLGIHFVNCGAYGRIYRNKEKTAYTGRCPKCGYFVKIPIGEKGTNSRFFKVKCP